MGQARRCSASEVLLPLALWAASTCPACSDKFVKVGTGYCRSGSDGGHPWQPKMECIELEACQNLCHLKQGCAGVAWTDESTEMTKCKAQKKPRCIMYIGEETVDAVASNYQEYTCYKRDGGNKGDSASNSDAQSSGGDADSEKGGCDSNCKFEDTEDTCRNRIQWSADNTFRDEKGPCAKAWAQVRSDCPSCGGCSYVDSGCSAGSPSDGGEQESTDDDRGKEDKDEADESSSSEPFVCSAGLKNWEAVWSDSKKEWCCKNKQKGCPQDEEDSGGDDSTDIEEEKEEESAKGEASAPEKSTGSAAEPLPLKYVGISKCTPEERCKRCEGDCDSDDDCETGYCLTRSGSEPVPGCQAGGDGDKFSVDYCASRDSPSDEESASKEEPEASGKADDEGSDGSDSDDSGDSKDSPAPAGGSSECVVTQTNEACRFPFRWQGVVYTTCTDFQNTNKWCAIKVDDHGDLDMTDGSWGDCSDGCDPLETAAPANSSRPVPASEDNVTACVTVGSEGAGAGLPCQFPFSYEGEAFQTCTYGGRGYKWCATKLDSDGKMEEGAWGYCSSACLSAEDAMMQWAVYDPSGAQAKWERGAAQIPSAAVAATGTAVAASLAASLVVAGVLQAVLRNRQSLRATRLPQEAESEGPARRSDAEPLCATA